MTQVTTEAKAKKTLHSRAPHVKWEKGVKVSGKILRGWVEPSRIKGYSDQHIVQILLDEPCSFKGTEKSKDAKTGEIVAKEVTKKVPAGSPVNVGLKGDCMAVFSLPADTEVSILCEGKEGQYWRFAVEYADAES